MQKRIQFVTVLLLVVGLLSACVAAAPTGSTQPAADQPAAAAGPKILKVRMPADLTNADPAFHPATPDTITAETVGEGLITFKPGTWELQNVLAENLTPSEDGLQIEFKLREGIQFQKGYGELTADDVKFSYERFLDEALNPPYKGDWEALDTVEVTGKYTGIIKLKRPFAPLWTSTLPVTAGVIVSKKALEEMGVEKYATNPVGTGPYEFAEWKPNEQITLKRYEGYWGEKPEWDEIHLIPIPDDSAAEIALEAGEVDFSTLPQAAVERFESNDQFQVVKIETLNYSGIFLNVESPKLQEIQVRQAIRDAIDVEAINAAAYEGRQGRTCAIFAPGQLGYWPEAPCYARDVEKAKAALAVAGVSDLSLSIMIQNVEDHKATAEVIQANLAEIGITAEINSVDDGVYWDLANVKDRELTVFDWTTTNPDPYWSIVWFSCEQIGQYNWMNWCDAEFDKLNTEATTTLDNAQRTELYIAAQKLWDANTNVVWTVRPTNYYGVRAGLEAVLSPNGQQLVRYFKSK